MCPGSLIVAMRLGMQLNYMCTLFLLVHGLIMWVHSHNYVSMFHYSPSVVHDNYQKHNLVLTRRTRFIHKKKKQ